MHELVLKYLSNRYWANQSNQVYDSTTDSLVYGDDLREDIIDMFDVSFLMATACIEIWVHDEYSTFETEEFWNTKKPFNFGGLGDGILPIAQRVAAQTVGLDLVAVQPMAAPSGLVRYLDFQYSAQSAVTQAMGVPAERLGHDVQVTINEDDEARRTWMALNRWRSMAMDIPVDTTFLSGITAP